jgi:hypothetical protein
VILAHDPICSRSASWQHANSVSLLSRGANQPFYESLVEDGTVRYVAEENIDIVKLEEGEEGWNLAKKILQWRESVPIGIWFDGINWKEGRWSLGVEKREIWIADDQVNIGT